MDYDVLRKDNDFHKWHQYEPLDTQYTKYSKENPSIIAAGHKIEDVYRAFANAKFSFMSAGYKDFGDLSDKSEFSNLYVKCHFLSTAIIEYARCLDLSWQVVWAYIQPASFEYLILQEYKKMEKACDRDHIYAQLDCGIAQKSMKASQLKQIVKNFDEDKDVVELRSIYNSLKHRGMIHFQGLGDNFESMMFGGIQGKSVSVLHRNSYSIEQIENSLLVYHNKFQIYFNDIINKIIPDDYFDTKVPLKEYFNTLIEMEKIQE